MIPRAAKNGVVGVRAGAVLVRLTAPPVDGAANDALIDVLASTLGVPKRSVVILSGERGRLKTVQVAGITADAAAASLGLAP